MATDGNAFSFENDTLKITYYFWAEHGTLSYTVFNKLNVPLYIDWKKSSYVKNSEKLDYWIDITTTNGVTKGHVTSTYYGTVYGKSYNNSTTVKPQQIVFIAPKSSISKDQFIIATFPKVDFDNNAQYIESKRTDQPKKSIQLKYMDYNEGNSILVFRNFLTVSTSDRFDKETYIDNGFYISRITEMDRGTFWGTLSGSTEDWRRKNDSKISFASPKNFYIEIK